ncbi:MAG: (d)CMP kinase [Bauldia sp.]|nr:(d)CMP kinase [Bauldia sp.]
MIIAIDGPAAAGKGTLAARLAAHFRLPYLDTGLLYRAVGKRIADRGLDPGDPAASAAEARALDPDELANPTLRGHDAGELASRIAVHPEVREALLAFQRDFAHRPGGAVLDGRDIGSTVAPDADVKIFVTASAEVRARRRTDELRAKGREVDFARILDEIRGRDARDAGRATAPLLAAHDAVILDTSTLDADQVFAAAVAIIETARRGPPVSPDSVLG